MRLADLPGDHRILLELLTTYRSSLEVTYTSLLAKRDMIPELSGVTRDLVYRHSLPLFAGLDAMGSQHPGAVQAVQGAIAAYSLPLICIDTYLDGSPSQLRKDETWWDQFATPLASAIHAGYSDVSLATGSVAAVELVATTASDVIRLMRIDKERRWHRGQLEPGTSSLSSYWHSPDSRLQGSGVGTVMLGLASILADRDPRHCAEIARSLGVLRQIADELLDVVEDVRAGLVTLPVLYGLLHSGVGPELREHIEKLWTGTGDSTQESRQDDDRLRWLVIRGGGPDKMRSRAGEILEQATAIAARTLPRPEAVVPLLRHRYSQAERAVASGLRDLPDPVRAPDLLSGSPS